MVKFTTDIDRKKEIYKKLLLRSKAMKNETGYRAVVNAMVNELPLETVQTILDELKGENNGKKANEKD